MILQRPEGQSLYNEQSTASDQAGLSVALRRVPFVLSPAGMELDRCFPRTSIGPMLARAPCAV